VLAESLSAPLDLPFEDHSAMDGYAVRSEELARATAGEQIRLRAAGVAPAGRPSDMPLEPGTCIRVFTGSVLPAGADAIVMQEDVSVEAGPEFESVSFREPCRPWENVRFRGEDVKAGCIVATDGERLSVGRQALLAALGIAEVRVGRKPVVGILPTGTELTPPGQPRAPGMIYESNSWPLAAWIRRAGGVPVLMPWVRDVPDDIRAALDNALGIFDAVLTTGGVSVGDYDFVKAAFEEVGGRLDLWKIAVKPGKPFAFGRRGAKLLFGLPGNPVSALVTYILLVHPALLRWQGATEPNWPLTQGRLAELLANRGDRPHFMRVRLDPSGEVRSAGIQASHILSSLAAANALLEIPPETAWEPGRSVSVLVLDPM